eukprot:9772929-Alexandrium_andersonii.AAC.1
MMKMRSETPAGASGARAERQEKHNNCTQIACASIGCESMEDARHALSINQSKRLASGLDVWAPTATCGNTCLATQGELVPQPLEA